MALTKVIGAGAEGLTLSSTSLTIANGLTLTDGDIALASGHGLSFAADSNASGMASELLDDYEEGTFTPAPNFSTSNGDASFGTAVGQYTKLGNMVYASVYIVGSESNASGHFKIGSFPFTISNSPTNYYTAAALYYNSFANMDGLPVAITIPNTTDVAFYVGKNGGISNLTETHTDGSFTVIATVSYKI